MHAIVMAGGRGTRLSPTTDTRPKALMPIVDAPLLHIILRQLAASGCTRVTLCIAHLGQMIRDSIGDGRAFGVEVDYCVDPEPLGTAGALRLVEDWRGPAIVLNADVLTALDFADLARTHARSRALVTVAVRTATYSIPFGIVETYHGRLVSVTEKPETRVTFLCGVQVVDPAVGLWLGTAGRLDMPDLLTAIVADGHPVETYRLEAAWHDIGTPENLAEATAAFRAEPWAYLGGTWGRRPVPVPR